MGSDLKFWVTCESAEGSKLQEESSRTRCAGGLLCVLITHSITEIDLEENNRMNQNNNKQAKHTSEENTRVKENIQ